jgi:hypothetical protein
VDHKLGEACIEVVVREWQVFCECVHNVDAGVAQSSGGDE